MPDSGCLHYVQTGSAAIRSYEPAHSGSSSPLASSVEINAGLGPHAGKGCLGGDAALGAKSMCLISEVCYLLAVFP